MQINARDWIFEVSAEPDATTPTWATIAGVESFDLNNTEGEESTTTTTFASNGNPESQAMARGASLSITGKATRTTAGVTDAGQALADELAKQIGEDSLGGVRFRHDTDDEWTVWTAWASKANTGGGLNDKTTWGATFMRSGPARVQAAA